MNKLKKLKQKEKIIKAEKNLYLISSILFLLTIIINILNLIYYPYLLNGLILEINIFMNSICIYLYIKAKKYINTIEDKKLEFKIKYILKNSSF